MLTSAKISVIIHNYIIISRLVDTRRRFKSNKQALNGNYLQSMMVCHWIGPELIPNVKIAKFWDQIALKDEEQTAIHAIQIAMDVDVERITMIGDDYPRFRGRRPIVKIKSHNPVSLKSLGNGAVRLFSTALAMTNCTNGFLLIDEVENGIHHSIQHQYWNMVLSIAKHYNIQIFATTHSIDCVKGFARAAINSGEEGVLYRLEKRGHKLAAIRYSEEELAAAAKFNTEVR